MGTAELSPNRTVAHLVPRPSGTPGRGVGGIHSSQGSKGNLKFGGRAGTSTAWQLVLILSPLPSGAVQILEGGRSSPAHPHLTTGCSLNCPTSEPLLMWVQPKSYHPYTREH